MGQRIAIIGAGPAGLTLAHFLQECGYGASNIDIYEATGRMGGESLTLHLFSDVGNETGTIFTHMGYGRIHRLMRQVKMTLLPYPTNGAFGYIDPNQIECQINQPLSFKEGWKTLPYASHMSFVWLKWMLGFLSREEEAENFAHYLTRKGFNSNQQPATSNRAAL